MSSLLRQRRADARRALLILIGGYALLDFLTAVVYQHSNNEWAVVGLASGVIFAQIGVLMGSLHLLRIAGCVMNRAGDEQ